MGSFNKVKGRRPANVRLVAASQFALEALELRQLLSTTVAAWNFDSLTVSTTPNLNPPASTGAGTAYSIGLQTSSGSGVSPQYPAYAISGASGTGDISDILNGTGNNPSGNQADHSSTGATSGTNATGTNPAWRVRGSSDGWSSNAPLGTQGAQFTTSTTGDSGISLSFDLDPSSTSAPSEIAVEYTTDGTTWNTVPAADLTAPTASTGATDGVTIASNSSTSTLITGGYFQIANNADALYWQNGFKVDFSSITAVNNDANFGVRIVNAATGVSEVEVGGTAFPAAGAGNWRIDNVQIAANGAATSAPTITTNPTNQTVAAGQPVTFTAAASGNPTPTVQWYKGAVGSGTVISGATSPTLTFTTLADGSENGSTYYAVFTNNTGTVNNVSTTAATLSDPLAAVTITTQPSAVSATSGNTATFTAAASGSPVPTVQWQSGPSATGSFTNITGATSATYSFTTATSQNGTFYRAVFTNSQSPSGVATNAVKLTVAGATIAAWNFTSTVAAPDNSPAATIAATTATANSLGFTNTYTYAGTTATNSVTNDDITLVAPEDVWRLRGHYVATGTAPNIGSPTGFANVNGWNSAAPQYSQGAEFDVSTVGYTSIAASFDWEATGQGVRNLQEQYNTNVANSGGWTNIGAVLVSPAGGGYLTGQPIDLTSITAANDDASFGIRLVSAYDPTYTGTGSPTYTAATLVSGSPVPINNSSGNWGFGNIQISGTPIPAAPTISSQPTNQTVAVGSPVSFTAAASGFPIPTVQWYSGAVGSGTAISGATSSTYTFTPTVAQSGGTYYAVFTNSQGSASTTAATLTVTAAPAITIQPISQTVAAGTSNVTFTAAASGSPTPTVVWEVEAPGATSFTPVTGANYTGATSPTLTILTANEGLTGNQYEAVFTNSSGSATTAPATLTVTGTPIAQWIFTGGQAPPTGGSTTNGTANAPFPTYGPLSNTSGTLGLNNDYTGIHAFPESDILVGRSTLNSSYSEYDWRVRSGNGFGPTGSPGTPPGWSQNAPEYANGIALNGSNNNSQVQGVQWNVNTTGYSNVTFQFDWQQGGISNMQPQYSPDGGTTWINAPSGVITANGNDFYGITSSTTTAVPIVVNLQSVAAANNNPNFEFRLVTAYNSSLPQISDGNQLDPAVHGQYSTGAPGAVNAQQNFQFNSGINDGDSVPLTYGSQTASFTYSSNPTTLIANMTAALTTLVGSGNFTVAPTNYTSATESSSTLLQPLRDGLGNQNTDMTVSFKGTLAATAVTTITTTNGNVAIATWVNGSANGFKPYVDGGGTWSIGKISFNGDNSTVGSGGLGIVTQPATATTAAESSTATFTATAYSEATPITAQWQVSTDGGSNWTNVSSGGTNIVAVGSSQYTSTYVLTTDATTGQSGNEYRVVFSAGGTTATSSSSTLTVVAPAAPAVVIQPQNTSVQGGNVTTLSATATGAPAPTVQWQVSSDGTNWNNVSNSTTYSGATAVTTTFAGYVATLSITSATGLNGLMYRAVFTNSVSSAMSSAATLTVLTPETILSAWDFNNTYPNVNSSPTSSDPYINNPAPVAAGVDGSVAVGGTAFGVGFNLPYAYYDSASGTDGNGAVNADDIVNSPGALNTTFNENTWRPRGGVNSGLGGTPANGFSNFVAPGSQGVQFSVPTTGYNNVYVTMDWYSTTSGELDAQEQYTIGGTTVGVTAASSSNTPPVTVGNSNPQPGTNNIATLSAANSFKFGDEVTVTGLPAPYNGTFQVVSATPTTFSYYTPTLGSNVSGVSGSAYVPTWTNINNPLQSVSNDFYGATATGAPVPLLINVSAIPGAANNPNFGVRLVNAYDPFLSNTQTLQLGDTSNFTLTFNGKTTGTINYSSNPTQMAANVQAALVALSTVGAGNVTVTAPQSSSTLTITFGGALNVIAQPAIVATDPNDNIVYTPQYANALLVTGPGPNGTTTQVPAPYNGSKGNWRFANIQIHGISTLPAWLAAGSAATWNAATHALNVTGAATIIADPGSDSPVITANGAVSQLKIQPITSNVDIHVGGITLTGGAGIDMASVGTGRSHSNHNTLVIGTLGATSDPAFSVDSTSTLNLEDNDLIVHTGSADAGGATNLAAVQALAKVGRHGGDWLGKGLTSSSAASQDNFDGLESVQLGVVLNSDLPTTLGSWTVGGASETLGANDIIAKYTYTGDFSLDGIVNQADNSIFGLYYDNGKSTGNEWAFGDTNGDGLLNRADNTAFGLAFWNGTPKGFDTTQL